MISRYAGYAGFTPAEESDIMLRMKVLAGEIYTRQAEAEFIKRQMFPSTATGEYLERHAAQRGLSRKPSRRASGSVLFFAEDEAHGDILIPAGTEVCTYSDMKRFVTDSDAVLSSTDDRVSVGVTAVEPGAEYNARGGTITVIVTPVLGIGSVYNSGVFTDGADEESDEELRLRVIDSYISLTNGANAAYYKGIAMSVDGVYSASVVGRGRGDGTVDVYISARGDTVSPSVKSAVQVLMNEGRELNTDVLVRDPEEVDVSLYIRISVEPGYAFAAVSEQVRTAVTDYINGLGIGAGVKLSKVGEVIYHVKGVADYRFVESYGSNTYVSDSQYPVADIITVGEI